MIRTSPSGQLPGVHETVFPGPSAMLSGKIVFDRDGSRGRESADIGSRSEIQRWLRSRNTL